MLISPVFAGNAGRPRKPAKAAPAEAKPVTPAPQAEASAAPKTATPNALPIPDFQATQSPNRCPFRSSIQLVKEEPEATEAPKQQAPKAKPQQKAEEVVVPRSEPVRYRQTGCGG